MVVSKLEVPKFKCYDLSPVHDNWANSCPRFSLPLDSRLINKDGPYC